MLVAKNIFETNLICAWIKSALYHLKIHEKIDVIFSQTLLCPDLLMPSFIFTKLGQINDI